jgi:nucleoside-diphosphate-sugar epimerase
MKVLFIGGTGIISAAVSRLAVERGMELYLLNRGKTKIEIAGAQVLVGDIHQPDAVRELLKGCHFDSVVNWINYTVPEVERDIALFQGLTDQYIFISTTAGYQKPPATPFITESMPLYNPFWSYAQNKILCEQRLMQAYTQDHFPLTIVRPGHTYDRSIPASMGGSRSYTIIDRMRRGLPVIVHGDGTSLWVTTHAEDFAKGFVGLVGHPRTIGQAFHITTDEVLTWNQICQITAAAVGVEPNIVHVPCDLIARVSPEIGPGMVGDKAFSYVVDNSKVKSFVPEFRATIPFHVGIRRALDWFHADPERCKSDAHINAEIEKILAAYRRAWD